jgi:glutaredoxin
MSRIRLESPLKTGWPPGLLQDDCSKLSRWFASRIDARETIRRVFRKKQMETIVYSKEDCPACDKLKAQLARDGEEFTEIKVGVDITREEFIAKFPQVRSMPHVIFKEVE